MKRKLYFMRDYIRKRVDYVKCNFDYKLYQEYLDGNLTRYDLLEQLQCTDYVFCYVLKELGLQTRYDYMQDGTNYTFFDIIDNEEKAYILGFYLADGSMSKNNAIKFTQSEQDSEILYKIRDILSPNAIIKKHKRYRHKDGYLCQSMFSFRVPSKHICDTLEKYGMGTRKTYNCSTDLSFIPYKYMIHFIRGYFDGDGTTSLTRGVKKTNGQKFENVTLRITSYTNIHLYKIKDFLYNNYNIVSNVIKEHRGNYILTVDRKKSFVELRDLLYKNAHIYIARKKDKMFNIKFELEPLSRKVKRTNTLTGEYTIYDTLKDAGNDFGVSNTSIRNWINKNKVVDEYKWEYL